MIAFGPFLDDDAAFYVDGSRQDAGWSSAPPPALPVVGVSLTPALPTSSGTPANLNSAPAPVPVGWSRFGSALVVAVALVLLVLAARRWL